MATRSNRPGRSVVLQSEQGSAFGPGGGLRDDPRSDRVLRDRGWIEVGLFGAFCLSLTIAVVGGRMAMITSATGSTALLMTGLVATGEARGAGLGVQYLMVAGLVTGLLQILWGYLRLAYQMRFVPQGVLSGFVNALALLIFQAQLPQLGLDFHHGDASSLLPHGGQIPIVWGLVLLGLVIIYGLPRLTRVVPSQLVAIVVLTAISIGFSFEIPTVSSLGTLPTGLPSFSLPFGEGGVPFSFETLGVVLPTALAISLVGLMETFLTQDILDDKTDTTTNKNVEARVRASPTSSVHCLVGWLVAPWWVNPS